MGYCYTRRMVVNPQDVKIHGEDNERFWTHHNRQPEEKENLRHLAHILPEAIDKYETGQILTEDEEIAYNIFVKEGPQLEYDCINQKFNIIDGRHRMFMLREEGIQLEMQVGCYDISQQEKDRLKAQDTTSPTQEQQEKSKGYFAELFSTIKECFDAITGREENTPKEITQDQVDDVIEKETIITKMAIVDNEINRSMVGLLDANVYQTTDEMHLIVEGPNLDGAQDLFQDEVIVLEER